MDDSEVKEYSVDELCQFAGGVLTKLDLFTWNCPEYYFDVTLFRNCTDLTGKIIFLDNPLHDSI